MDEIFIKICKCGKKYETTQKKKRLCPECIAEREMQRQLKRREIYKSSTQTKNKKKPALTIYEVCRIEKIYNTVNKTWKHYHEIADIINKTPKGRCVCCNGRAYYGRLVCPECEKEGEAK